MAMIMNDRETAKPFDEEDPPAREMSFASDGISSPFFKGSTARTLKRATCSSHTSVIDYELNAFSKSVFDEPREEASTIERAVKHTKMLDGTAGAGGHTGKRADHVIDYDPSKAVHHVVPAFNRGSMFFSVTDKASSTSQPHVPEAERHFPLQNTTIGILDRDHLFQSCPQAAELRRRRLDHRIDFGEDSGLGLPFLGSLTPDMMMMGAGFGGLNNPRSLAGSVGSVPGPFMFLGAQQNLFGLPPPGENISAHKKRLNLVIQELGQTLRGGGFTALRFQGMNNNSIFDLDTGNLGYAATLEGVVSNLDENMIPATTSPPLHLGVPHQTLYAREKRDNKGTMRPVLYMPTDNGILSDYQCLVRKQIEIFEAGEEDVESNAQGRNKPIVSGQVGIRCNHCSNIPPRHRTRGSTYYPAKLNGLYQAAQNMASSHLRNHCQLIPDSLRHELTVLRDRKSSAGGGKKYWAGCVSVLGVIDDDGILRFKEQEPSAASI